MDDDDELEECFQECRKLYMEKTSVKNLKERASLPYAIFLMTAVIMKEKLDVKFHIKAILDFLLKNEAESAKDYNRDLGMRFYKKFMEYVWTNKVNFIRDRTHCKPLKASGIGKRGTKSIPKVPVWGLIKDCGSLGKIIGGKKVSFEVTVRQAQFERIVKELGFEDSTNILKKLKKEGLLNCERDRLTRSRTLDAEPEELYVFWFTSEEEEVDETEKALAELDEKELKKYKHLVNRICGEDEEDEETAEDNNEELTE